MDASINLILPSIFSSLLSDFELAKNGGYHFLLDCTTLANIGEFVGVECAENCELLTIKICSDYGKCGGGGGLELTGKEWNRRLL